mgnify:CR=1 FL=1
MPALGRVDDFGVKLHGVNIGAPVAGTGSAISFDSEPHICSAVPSNKRPQPIENSASPQNSALSPSNQNAICPAAFQNAAAGPYSDTVTLSLLP